MADLTTLIRMHKHELDQKRLALAQLHDAEAALVKKQQDLDRQFEQEKEAAKAAGEIPFTFSHYADQVAKQKRALKEQQKALEKKVAAAKDSMMETFSELKKYEMTQAERERLAAEERLMKESAAMDEIGIETFRRKDQG